MSLLLTGAGAGTESITGATAMSLLTASNYDPAIAVTSASTATLTAMTAIDTTNLRCTFTAPANGSVLVRLKCQIHGATTFGRIVLGVLDGSTVKMRLAPTATIPTGTATLQYAQEAVAVVSGLTPGNSYTWDAAYGVQVVIASTAIKYGGPNNTTTNDAFGAFHFEVWSATSLLGGVLYDPAVAVTLGTGSLLAMTAIDTTNMRITFTAPTSGNVMWRLRLPRHGSTTFGQYLFGILDGSTVKARSGPLVANPVNIGATGTAINEASGVITGLTPGNSYTYDAAYGVEIVGGTGGLKYGGPDDASGDDAFGGAVFDIWQA